MSSLKFFKNHLLLNPLLFSRLSSSFNQRLLCSTATTNTNTTATINNNNSIDDKQSSSFLKHEIHPSEEELPEYSGGMKSRFTTNLKFLDGQNSPIPSFQVLDLDGNFLSEKYEKLLDLNLIKRFHKEIIRLNVMDEILNQAQRQGRISFYMTSYGEEATHFGPAAALKDQDLIFGQYREPGLLLWRGWKFEQFVNQLYGNILDVGKGRQMPIHYGSRELNYVTIKSTLASGMSHAVGAAYGFKLTNQDRVTLSYFGDGAASEGDAHAAFNFAATLGCPCILLCRNNGYAISTPIKEQYHGDGIVVRGPALGIPSIRVDGNDVLACYYAVKEARKICIQESRPVLIEAMTYRLSHHSTSDDSSVYRSDIEVKKWKESGHPLNRLEKLLKKFNEFNSDEILELKSKYRKELISLLDRQEKLPKWPIKDMFTDIYFEMPDNLIEQHQQLLEHLKLYKKYYPDLENFKDFDKELNLN